MKSIGEKLISNLRIENRLDTIVFEDLDSEPDRLWNFRFKEKQSKKK